MADLVVEHRALESVRDVSEAEGTSSESEDSCSGMNRDAVTVGNLDWSVTERMLEETFRQLGQVESVWMQREGCDLQGMLSGVVVCGREMSVRSGVCGLEDSDAEEDCGRGSLVEEEI